MPPRDALFWDGVSWATRMLLVIPHLIFGVIAILRPNVPLLYQGYSAFDDAFAFSLWGLWHLGAAFLLLVVPTRVPFGLFSTLASGFLSFFTGAVFSIGGGLLFGGVIFYAYGALAGALFMRSLWLYMVRVGWFRRHVMRKGPHA